MSVPVVTAIADTRAESALVGTLGGRSGPLEVVRRCVDVAELLAAAQAGIARAALVSPGLRRFDRDAVGRLAAAGAAVVGVVPADDEHAERRLRQLGITVVARVDAGADTLAAAVREAMDRGSERSSMAWLHPAERPGVAEAPFPAEIDAAEGRLIACWGPTGAPGRTSVAVGLAAEFATLDIPTLLVDVDTYGGTVAQLLGLLDESSGLAAAARLANTGALDAAGLRANVRQVTPRLGVLTGLVRPDRWPELGRSLVDRLWELTGAVAAITVVDCGFSVEEDEELSYDTSAPRRNGATLSALHAADDVVAVCAADAVGVQRFVRAYADLSGLLAGTRVHVVCTKVRPGPVGPRPGAQVSAALERYANVTPSILVPDDRDGYDKALARGRTLTEVAPRSPARLALQQFACALAGVPMDGRRATNGGLPGKKRLARR